MLNRLWYNRPANKPWRDGDRIKIHVRGDTLDKTLEPSEYFTTAIVDNATSKIFDFYGREKSILPGEISHEERRFADRPGTKPSLLISIDQTLVAAATRITSMSAQNVALTKTYSTRNFRQRVETIGPLFKDYQKKYKFFDGSVSPGIDFVQEYNRVATAASKVIDYIEFNNLTLRTKEDDEISIKFDAEYNILGISLIQNAQEKFLTEGSLYYLQDSRGLTNKRTNELLYNLGAIYSERNAPSPWTAFLSKYVSTVTVDFFGRPRTQKCWNTILEKQDKNNPVVVTLEQMADEVEYLNHPKNQECLMNEAIAEKIKNNEDIKKIVKGMQAFEDKADMVRNFIDKYGINHLIEAALECLAYQSGIARDDMPTLPGANPFRMRRPPAKIKLPSITIQLPAVSIGGGITAMIKKALMEALMSALIGTLQALADVLLELCYGKGDDIGEALPLNALIDDFPNPAENAKEGGIQAGLGQCYEEYAIDPAVGDEFLGLVAGSITPREVCNLVNDVPSPAVLRIITNIIEFTPSLSSLQDAFDDEDDLVGFFVCIGNLLSPAYCASLQPIDITELDPCTIEELLARTIDDDLFDDLINAYRDPNSLAPSGFNLRCGGGIVPPLTDMPAFRHSLTTLFNTVFEIPKSSFASDITGLKTIYMKPEPGCSAKNADFREKLKEIKEGQSTGNEAKPNSKDMEALKGLLPTALLQHPGIKKVKDLMDNVDEVAGCEGVGVTYEIARQYRDEMANIDAKIVCPYFNNAGPVLDSHVYADMFFYFIEPGVGVIYLAPGAPAGSGELGGATLITGPATTSAIQSQVDLYGGTDNEQPREVLAERFFSNTFGAYKSPFTWIRDEAARGDVGGIPVLALGAPAGAPGSGESDPNTPAFDSDLMKQAAKLRLYFDAYLSLLNSTAYNVRNSKLFTVEGFKKLALLPIPCGNGRVIGKDLFDINTIINEGLEEFADNSCSDRTCVVGPVEDSLIFAASNAYIQILLLEQLLKNIFIIDAYGAAAVVDNAAVQQQIINEIYRSAEAGDGAGFLPALMQSAIIYVDKQRERSGPSVSGENNLLPDPHDPEETIEIPMSIMESADLYRRYALEYLIKKRMSNTLPVFKEVFTKDEPTFDTSFILNAFPTVDVIDKGFWEDPLDFEVSGSLDGSLLRKDSQGPVRNYSLVQDEQGEEPASYNYGLDPWNPSQTLSADEVEYAKGKGLFTREKFVSFDINYEALKSLQQADPPPTAGSGVAIGSGKGAPATEHEYGLELRQAIYNTLKPLLDIILPPEAGQLPMATSWQESPGSYEYSPDGDNMVVSPAKFEEFLTAYRNLSTQEVGELVQRETVFARDTELFGEIDATYSMWIRVDDGMDGTGQVPEVQHAHSARQGWSDPNDEANALVASLPDSPIRDFYPSARKRVLWNDMGLESNYSKHSYVPIAVKGPIRRKNYDALRYWNKVMRYGPAKVEVNSGMATQVPFEGTTYETTRVIEPRAPLGSSGADEGWTKSEVGMNLVSARLPYSWNVRPNGGFGTMIKVVNPENENNPTESDWSDLTVSNARGVSNMHIETSGLVRYCAWENASWNCPDPADPWAPESVPEDGESEMWIKADASQTNPTIYGEQTNKAPGGLPPSVRHKRAIGGAAYETGRRQQWAINSPGPMNMFIPEATEQDEEESGIYPYDDLNGRIRLEWPEYYPMARTHYTDIPTAGNIGRPNGFYTYRISKTDLYYNEWNVAAYFGFNYKQILEWLQERDLDEEALVKWWTRQADEPEVQEMVDDIGAAYPQHGIVGMQRARAWGHPLKFRRKLAIPTKSSVEGDASQDRSGGWGPLQPIRYSKDLPKWDADAIGADIGSSDQLAQLQTWDFYDQPVGVQLSGPGSSDFYTRTNSKSLDAYIAEVDGAAPVIAGAPPGLVLPGIPVAEEDAFAPYNYDGAPLPAQGYAKALISEVLDDIIGNINIGTRIAYNSPLQDPVANDGESELLNSLAVFFDGMSVNEQDRQFISQKSNYVLWEPPITTSSLIDPRDYFSLIAEGLLQDPNFDVSTLTRTTTSTSGYVLNVNTGIEGRRKIADHVAELRSARRSKLSDLFDIHKKEMALDIAGHQRYQNLFNGAFDTEKLVGFVFLYGILKTEAQSSDFRHLFDDTKQALRIVIRAALAGDDYTYVDPESVSDSDAARNAALGLAAAAGGPFVQMGASFVLKMLIETPLRILKGLAEIVDPHVIVGNAIRNVSGQALKIADPIWETAQGVAGPVAALTAPQVSEADASTAAALAAEIGTAALTMDLPEFLDAGIEEAFSGLPRPIRPSISDKGLNLIGTLPYLFALPPGPFGIAYILLDLMNADWGTDSLPEASDDQECILPPPPPRLLPRSRPADVDDAEEVDIDGGGIGCAQPKNPPKRAPKVNEAQVGVDTAETTTPSSTTGDGSGGNGY